MVCPSPDTRSTTSAPAPPSRSPPGRRRPPSPGSRRGPSTGSEWWRRTSSASGRRPTPSPWRSTPPSAPVIVTALPGSASAFLSWSYAATAAAPVTSFQMDLDGGAPIDIGADANRTVGGLLQGHAYSIRVRGVNGAGAGPWSEPRTVTPRAPGILFHGLPVPVRAVDSRLSGGPHRGGSDRVVPVVAVTGAAPRPSRPSRSTSPRPIPPGRATSRRGRATSPVLRRRA